MEDTVIGFDKGLDIIDLGGNEYTVRDTSQGTVLTHGTDTILLYGIHDFEI